MVAGLIIWGFFALVATILDVGESAPAISGMGLVLGVIVAFIIIKVSKKGSSIAKNASDRLLNNVVDINNRTVNNAPARISHLRSQYDNIVYNLIPENDAKMIVTYKNYEEVIEAFAPNYRYSRCIDKVIFYIRNMRADTLKEALNMFEQEEFQNRVLDNQELQTLYAAVTAGASLETARNTGRIAENTDKMVTSLENIEQYSAQTAMNTAAIADNTFMAAQSAAYAARKSGESAKYLKSIDSACRGGW